MFGSNNKKDISLKELLYQVKLNSFIGERNIDDIQLGERASKISGGEKQRIAIARSLYKNFDLLFLDEFTSSLDVKTEEKIIGNIMNKYSDKTLIVISHKQSTLKMCDKIINLDEKHDNKN